MEPVKGELQGFNTGGFNLLGLPEPCLWDSDDELLGVGRIKPKSSPIPRRRSSLSCSDDDSQPPPSSSRRVSFADAFGLSLVSVKQFDTRSLCDPTDPLEVDLNNSKECFLKLHFALPVTLEELLYRVQEQKVDLESLELLPGTTTLKGTVRVLNLCFDKLVYIRTSLDCWSSHFDLLAEYVPESSQGITDCFSFRLTLVPPFGQQGARVDFCIRYETPFGTFWANNSGQNYVLFCHEKAKEQDENEKLQPKSCLKPRRHSSITGTTSNAEITLNCGIAAVSEPVDVKENKAQEEHQKLKQEESSRNCSRRNRRKAARMAKIQQYFAQRDEDLQQTEKDTDEVDVPVPAIDEAPLNLSTPQTNVTSLLSEPSTEGQKLLEGSIDVERKQVSATQTTKQEMDNFPVIHPELITSKSPTRQPALDSENSRKSGVDLQLLENSLDKETVNSQSGSLKCQMEDKSIGKTVEKAWEYFEKSAMEKMGSATNTNCNVHQTNQMDNTLLENNQESQPFGHHYTFETIVAPLYHQVFEKMENERKKIKNSTSRAEEAAGKLDHGRLRVVTYPSVETRSNPKISAKHVNDDDPQGACRETFRGYLHNTKSATENALSVSNVQTKPVAQITFQDTAVTDDLSDDDILAAKAAQVLPLEKQQNSDFSGEATIDQTEKTPEKVLLQSDIEYTLDNQLPDSGYSPHILQHEQTRTYSVTLPTMSEEDTTAAKPFENAQDRSVTQISLETRISCEIDEMEDQGAQTSERTSNTHISCLDESYTPVPDPTLFYSDIISNVTTKNILSDASPSCQNLTQEPIQTQIPAMIPHLQTTDDKNLIQDTTQTCENGESFHYIGSKMDSNRSDSINICESIENESEILQMSSQETAVDVNQVSETKEHQNLLLNSPDEDCELDLQLLAQDTAMLNIRSNSDDPEYASQEEGEENIQIKNPGKNEAQELAQNHPEEVAEIKEVENKLEEEEEGKQQQQRDKQVENEEQESDELGYDEFKDESYYTEDDEDDGRKDDEDQDAEPRRSEEDEKDLQQQETVNSVTSVATLQSIPTIDSSIREIHLNVEDNLENTGSEQISEVGERHVVGGEEESFSGTNSSRQALTMNLDVAFSNRNEEGENDSKRVDREEDVCQEKDKSSMAEDATAEVDTLLEKQDRESLNEQGENMDDSTSTESLTDDEMELYLLRLKNTQQTGVKDAIAMGKRHSISRTRTIPSPMPSIAEYMDEDQPNAFLDDLTPELERDALHLLGQEEEVIDPNLLWWREFFSYDNMTKMIVYTLLFVIFLITAYFCDFIACFGLYLIALYWLYFQVQREPFKST